RDEVWRDAVRRRTRVARPDAERRRVRLSRRAEPRLRIRAELVQRASGIRIGPEEEAPHADVEPVAELLLEPTQPHGRVVAPGSEIVRVEDEADGTHAPAVDRIAGHVKRPGRRAANFPKRARPGDAVANPAKNDESTAAGVVDGRHGRCD